MHLFQHQIQTSMRQRMISIQRQVEEDLKKSGIQEGLCVIFTPHTTAGITINENADPNVCNDMIYGYEKVYPTADAFYHHFEGNSAAHMKSTAFNCNQSVIVHQGQLLLGIWQDIYFCEFDGPRNREYYVKIIEG